MRCWFTLAVILAASAAALAIDAGQARLDLQKQAPGVRMHFDNALLARVYGTTLATGASPQESAAAFVAAHADAFGAAVEDLRPGLPNGQLTQPLMFDEATGSFKFTLFYYHQARGGLPVYDSDLRVLVRNDADRGFPVVLASAGLRDLGDLELTPLALARVDVEAGFDAARRAVPGLAHFGETELVIWAGVEDTLDTPRLATLFIADNGLTATAAEVKYKFVADAVTGEILHSESMILDVDIAGNVSAQSTTNFVASVCDVEVLTPMPYARVSISGETTYADANGDFVLPYNGVGPVLVNSQVRGKYFRVLNQGGPNSQLSLEVTPPGPVQFEHNTSLSEQTTAEVNCYIEANRVRDMVLAANPLYNIIWQQEDFPINVNIDSTCNAFYNYQSINFFRSGGGCNNTGFGDVVHHEFGHHVVATGYSGQGAYGEGMADIVGFLVTQRPELGVGFSNCNSGIRNADNDCQFKPIGCSTCGSEIHACGQLISGAVWDLRDEFMITEPGRYHELTRDLAINSVPLHSGTSIDAKITIDFLTLDDDDANIYNGTPHYVEIATAFNKHGLPAPPLPPFEFAYPAGRPEWIAPAGGTSFRVELNTVIGQVQVGTERLHYNPGNGWMETPLVEVEPGVYDAVFPAAPCGRYVDYYLSAQSTGNETLTDPERAPDETFTALSVYGLTLTYADDFEASQGWTVFAGAERGNWELADPELVETGGVTTQPEDDHSVSGTLCFVTGPLAGLVPGFWDLDGGPSILTSPVFDLAGRDAFISYWRWFHLSGEIDDALVVEVSNDGGVNWVEVERLEKRVPWAYAEWLVSDYVAPSSEMRVRFTVSDEPSNSLLEALVDDFQVHVLECGPPMAKGDMNCDRLVDFGDINPFIKALGNPAAYQQQFPNCDIKLGDINEDGKFDFGDINPFIQLLTR